MLPSFSRPSLFALICLSLISFSEIEAKTKEAPKSEEKKQTLTADQLYEKASEMLVGKKVRHDPKGAVEILIENGDKGHVPSLVLLSGCCMEGLGTQKNPEAAIRLMVMAANKGAPDAQRRLALYYYEGLGVPRDYKTALYWFKKAAKQNDPLSLYFLGTFYSQGLEIEKDDAEALSYFLKAAYLNEPRAQVIAAGCYANGFGIPRDYGEAFAWALVAADNGFPTTKNQLYPLMTQRALDEARPRAKELQKKIAAELKSAKKR